MESKYVILTAAFATFVFYVLRTKFIRHRRQAAAIARLGCQPPPRVRHRAPFGLDLLYELYQADRKKVVPEYLRERFARAGATTYSSELLGATTFSTIDPENLQAILSTQFKDFCLGPIRRASFLPFLGHGIFTEDGEEWERSRAMLRPHFSRSQISDLGLEEAHVQNMIRMLPLDEAGWTAEVDLQTIFFRLTLDSATHFLLGKSVNSQNATRSSDAKTSSLGGLVDGIQFGKAFDICSKWLADRAELNEAYWLRDGKEFRENCKITHQFVDHFVEMAMNKVPQNKTDEKNHTFLDSLLEQTNDRVKIRSELINILLAGRDTTAGFLGWLFYILARHPDIYSKLRNIIVKDFGSYEYPEAISLDGLKNCHYLQNCLHETLRLFPPVPANSRQAVRDTTIPRGGGPDGMGKVFIRKNQQVIYTVYALHRRRDLWGPDADDFNPDRWTGRKHGWDYLPFNGGPRVCLGQQFALTEVSYVTVRMLQRFDKLENRDTETIAKHNLSLNDSPFPGVKVMLRGATQTCR
ncbi:hypothetical protein MMC07_002991 [Pseudocyphellaria aurata]|nr:hypothetical protein [Pseudocyphellaria aurata]